MNGKSAERFSATDSMKPSASFWAGFRDGIRGKPLGWPLEFHDAYERGWILGATERRAAVSREANAEPKP